MTRPLLVASLTEPPTADGEEIRRLAGRADWLELRADLVGDVAVEWLRERFAGPLLYTLRSRAEGGQFSASRERRKRRIVEQAAAFDRVDLEGDRDLVPEILDAIAPEKRVVSWHGPAADAPALRGRLEHLSKTPAAIYKLAPRAAASGDELAPLELLATSRRHDVAAFATGEIGSWTRVVAALFGSPLVYGSVGAKPAAPGQLPIDRMIDDLGLPELPPVERLFGVVGRPVLGSLSPALHNALYRALGIPALFLPFEVESFGDFWLEIVENDALALLGLPLAGLAVTTPFKEVAVAVAGASSPLADRLQSANTLVVRRGVWEAESTDGLGVLGALVARGIDPRPRRVAVIGAGGAGRAAAFALARAGAQVTIVNRGIERGLASAKALGLPFVPATDFDPSRYDLFVHATPLGRQPGDEAPLAVGRLPAASVAVDLVYLREPTRLVADCRRRGLTAIDGREVLLHQAAPQFKMMTGRDLPIELGRRALGLEERA